MRLAEYFIVGALISILGILIFTTNNSSKYNHDRLEKERALMIRIIALEKKVGIR